MNEAESMFKRLMRRNILIHSIIDCLEKNVRLIWLQCREMWLNSVVIVTTMAPLTGQAAECE